MTLGWPWPIQGQFDVFGFKIEKKIKTNVLCDEKIDTTMNAKGHNHSLTWLKGRGNKYPTTFQWTSSETAGLIDFNKISC